MRLRLVALAALTISFVIGASLLSASLWGDRPEKTTLPDLSQISAELTPAELITRFDLPPAVVLHAFGIDSSRIDSPLTRLGLSPAQAGDRLRSAIIKYQEEQSKNWRKIALKFLLWFLFLPLPFVMLLRRRMTPRRRLLLAGAAVVTFGVALGADPSPMGTVKDAIYLIAAHQTVFMPRIIALSIFLLTVVLANKFICSYGCQFGLLQEFLFRLNRGRFDRKGILRQYKPPFWLSNGIRITVFAIFTAVASLWAVDLIGLVDPFKIFNPAVMTVLGIGFVALVLVASLLVYRPWCHFACPFGLVSWVFEKLAIFRIKVDHRKCDACNLCARSCPSTVMDAILKREKAVIPDCFACGACIDVCPRDAVRFTADRSYEGNWNDSLALRDEQRRPKNPFPV